MPPIPLDVLNYWGRSGWDLVTSHVGDQRLTHILKHVSEPVDLTYRQSVRLGRGLRLNLSSRVGLSRRDAPGPLLEPMWRAGEAARRVHLSQQALVG